MVISKLNLNKIETLLSFIQESLNEIRKLAEMSEGEFSSSKKNIAAAESFLRRSLEAIFDIGRHILAKTHGFKDLEYKAIAKGLGEKGIISSEYSNTLLKMAGYRNRMVHLYNKVSDEEIFDLIQNHSSDIEHFINEITKFIKKYRKYSATDSNRIP